MKKNLTIYIIITLLCASFIGCAKEKIEQPPATSIPTQQIESQRVEEKEVEEPYIPGQKEVDFAALQAENSDILAWIEIPGTVIDYPVAQTFDNQFYLDYAIGKDPDEYGSIFLDCESASDFTDKNTVVYGHNNDDGTMFSDLHRFEEEDFRQQNRYVYIYTPRYKYVYKIFATYTRDNKRILWQADFDNDEFYNSYLQSIYEKDGKKDFIFDDIEVTVEDQIISLSTCIKYRDMKRYIVTGVLVDQISTSKQE